MRIRGDAYESKVLTFNLKVYLSTYHSISYVNEPFKSIDFAVTINPDLTCTLVKLSTATVVAPTTNVSLSDW